MSKTELKILAIDTATEACSVALNLGGEITHRSEIAPKSHSKLVLGMVEFLLQQSGLELRQLDALAVDVGPGSFTGVRIGIGTAQGLAYGAGLKVVPVGSLETLAYDAAHETVLAAIDARMGQVYYGLYANPVAPQAGLPEAIPEAIIEPALASPQHLNAGQRSGIVGVGSGWDRYAPVLLESLNGSLNESGAKWLAGRYPDAQAVSRIAAVRGMQSACSPLELTASYIRDEVATVSAER